MLDPEALKLEELPLQTEPNPRFNGVFNGTSQQDVPV